MINSDKLLDFGFSKSEDWSGSEYSLDWFVESESHDSGEPCGMLYQVNITLWSDGDIYAVLYQFDVYKTSVEGVTETRGNAFIDCSMLETMGIIALCKLFGYVQDD